VTKRITIVDGHPDPSDERLCHALARAYAEGARGAGHDVRLVMLATLDFPLLRSAADWERSSLAPALKDAQEAIGWAEHLLFVHPLWLGEMPALLKGFLEQVLRPGFAIQRGARTLRPGLLNGRSAHVVITMGMPAPVYRWWFRSHGLRSFEWNILRFVGIHPVHKTLIGNVAASSPAALGKWLEHMRGLGREGT
jgi:putative NADPH-quinone reductase